jgi:hypothetical protein
MIVVNMKEEELKELAKRIAESQNKYEIIKEIEWFLQGHYTKCRFLALLMTYNLYKPEYNKISEELMNKDLLFKLYNTIQEIIYNKS